MTVDLFRTRDHVPDFDALITQYGEMSAAARDSLAVIADISYGITLEERLDLFLPPGGGLERPVHLFIHGGYWRMFSKRDFSFVAETVTAAGAIAVVIDYALMPGVRLGTIVEQVRRARAWITGNIRSYGGDPERLTVSGHSAGAHLASFLFDRSQPSGAVTGALLLGGIYDLAPLQHSFLQPLIALTDDEVRQFSPLSRPFRGGVAATVLFGERETEPFHSQAAAFAAHLAAHGVETSSAALAGTDHMSSVRDLGIPGSEAGRLLAQMIAGRPAARHS